MPRYLWKVSYTTEGLKGLLKEGGTSRRRMIEEVVASLDGRLEAFYYAFGEDDLYLITELPDHASAVAISLVTGAAGAAHVKTTVLIDPDEVDRATQKSVPYRPPAA